MLLSITIIDMSTQESCTCCSNDDDYDVTVKALDNN